MPADGTSISPWVAVFGWPGPILAVVFAGGAAWVSRGLCVGAAVAILPFSVYLGMTPRFTWALLLPLVPLAGARAISRGSERWAWLAVLLLAALIAWIALLLCHPVFRPTGIGREVQSAKCKVESAGCSSTRPRNS